MYDNYLPDGWRQYKIKDIGAVITGNTPPRNEPENYGGDLAWIKPPDLDKTIFISDSEEKISEIGRRKVRLLPKGSVLVGCIGNIGKVAIADSELCTNQQINGIIPNKEIVDSIFLFYTMKRIRPKLEQIASSAVVPLLNKTDFSNIEISLPPLPIQKKIAAILEKAERLKEWRKEADKLTDEFLKSTFLEMFGDPQNNPKKWEKLKIRDVTIHHKQGFYTTSNYVDSGIKLVRITDITEFGKLTYDTMPFLDLDSKTIEQFKVQKGDFLFARSGVSIGRCAIVETDIPCVFGSYIIRFRFDTNKINNKFIWFSIKLPQSQLGLKQLAHGSTNPNINAENIKNIEIIVPPLHLQQKFAQIVEKVEPMRQIQNQSGEEVNNLFNALMQQAFKGELAC